MYGGEAPPRELTLDEMLADPIVRIMMNRDRVSEEDVREAIRDASRRKPATLRRPN
ncbi:hypothetical protein [Radicibacter daui]|uniref:hypothetical protein n=1 Tax=Radicibacter daui TaxID=3064829 RepID=UPI004046910E